MAEPLSRTFNVLAISKDKAAVDLLIAALDSRSAAIKDRAIAALLRRGATRCQTEVIRRFSSLSPAGHRLLEEQGSRLFETLRQCLLHGDAELRANALSVVSTLECYNHVATLLQVLGQRENPFQAAGCEVLKHLVGRLSEQLHEGSGRKASEAYQRNLPQAAQMTLMKLENACNRFADLAFPGEIVECILVLGGPESAAVRKVLLHSPPACREAAANLLSTSRHPGVLRLVMEFMTQNYPFPKVFEVFENRSDRDFVYFVLRHFPKRLSENQQKNFKQLTRIAWIADETIPLETVPAELHESLAEFVQATGMKLDDKIELQKWLLLHGSIPGRQAATKVLESFAPEAARGILFGSLDSDEEDVQAWATSQLRSQGVPEAIRLLIERLDSPLPAVREAAREELGSFNLGLVLGIFEHLDRSVCLQVGGLLRKTDPDSIPRLLEELTHPIQRRRIRAVRAAQALELAGEVESGLVTMLSDEDALVRRVAAEVLAAVPTPQVLVRLSELLQDASPRVREAAQRSLAEIGRTRIAMGAPRTGELVPK